MAHSIRRAPQPTLGVDSQKPKFLADGGVLAKSGNRRKVGMRRHSTNLVPVGLMAVDLKPQV